MGCNVRLEDDATHAEKLDACEQAVKMTLEIVKKDDVDNNRAPLPVPGHKNIICRETRRPSRVQTISDLLRRFQFGNICRDFFTA